MTVSEPFVVGIDSVFKFSLDSAQLARTLEVNTAYCACAATFAGKLHASHVLVAGPTAVARACKSPGQGTAGAARYRKQQTPTAAAAAASASAAGAISSS
jgi:hypothetical protein